MNKSDLVEALARETGLRKRMAEWVVKEVFEAMAEALEQGRGIEIRGFGTFAVKEYEGYEGRNPKTGERIKVPPKRLPAFRMGKDLRKRLNPGLEED